MKLDESMLITPYGGVLVNLVVAEPERSELLKEANLAPSFQVSPRALCDLELLATGAMSPLTTFMGKADYLSVLNTMRLQNGTVFPIPITLPVPNDFEVSVGKRIALRAPNFQVLAVLDVAEVFELDKAAEANALAGGMDAKHPLVAEMSRWGDRAVTGRLQVVDLPQYVDFPELRRTPEQVRRKLIEIGKPNVVAFQTRNPLHRAHEELTKRAQHEVNGSLLIHPVVGLTKPGDVDHYTRVRAYRALVDHHYNAGSTLLSLFPLAMRLAGPREAVWHAIMRRNYGANHLIVGRDHAGPGLNSEGKPFYGPYDAQELVSKLEPEIGVKMVAFKEMLYLPDEDRYEPVDHIPEGTKTLSISGTQVRDDYLAKGVELPGWFTRKEVAQVLADAYPPKVKQGFTVWFTGLPSSGKSTVADLLSIMLLREGRHITILDGDVVRTHLSKGLGFSREDRDTNILRIGYVCSEITRHNGVAIAAAISPYEVTRQQVKQLVGGDRFVLVYVATPLDVCEQRDVKGLFQKAKAGLIKGVTGIDDPYEPPAEPTIVLHTEKQTAEEGARQIIDHLRKVGFLPQSD